MFILPYGFQWKNFLDMLLVPWFRYSGTHYLLLHRSLTNIHMHKHNLHMKNDNYTKVTWRGTYMIYMLRYTISRIGVNENVPISRWIDSHRRNPQLALVWVHQSHSQCFLTSQSLPNHYLVHSEVETSCVTVHRKIFKFTWI